MTLILPSKFVSQTILFQSARNTVIRVTTEKSEVFIVKVSEDPKNLSKAASCLSKISHPNIVVLKDTLSFPQGFGLVLENIPGLDLFSYLRINGTFSEKEAKPILKKLTDALCYLHSQGWSHGDIKIDNIVFDSTTGNVKLIDFESSCRIKLRKRYTKPIGTFEYSPPEVRFGSYSGPEVDVWCLGVSLYCLIVGSFPFSFKDLKAGTEVLKVSPKWSEDLKDLMLKMIEKNVSKRFSMTQVSKHQWLESLVNEKKVCH